MDKLLAKLDRVPIRWRLALTSAGLTAVILALFALTFGLLITNQLRSSFDENLEDTVENLGDKLPQTVRGELPSDVFERILTGDAAFRLLAPDGTALGPVNAPDLGPPTDRIHESGGYRVATDPVLLDGGRFQAHFLQYGEPVSRLHANIARVRLLLVLGVLGGTALALLAGLAVARRAMAPIAALTNAAKGVARTRDPGVRLPKPVADDEVADLARTLEQMLMALDQSRTETESALARQREFVADASHELRTPLTSVLANLELLEAALAGEDAEIASSALRSSRRMRRLVADLLLLARADAGRRAPRRLTDLAGVARDAAAEVAPLAEEHDLELDVEPGAVVDGTPDDLHRLALNLLENAVRHTPPGTAVRGSVRRDGEAAVLVVEDEGPGIPPDQRPRVFERFVRGPGDAGPGGSGLGLAIVRAVAESHGGEVALADGPGGRGARFTVRLPASDASPSQEPSGARVAG
ncbi:MAG: HAMP domain-containing sensor histidine kinase [Thermoleophilaceae bacterium]